MEILLINLIFITSTLIKSISSETNVPIFILPLNVCNSPSKTIHKLHATGNNLTYSIIDGDNYNYLKLSNERLVLVEKVEKENVTIKIGVTSRSSLTSESLSSLTPPYDLPSVNHGKNEIILKLNISSKYCSMVSTEDEWKATRAVIVTLSVLLIFLLTILSLTLICVWRREKRRKQRKISIVVNPGVNISTLGGGSNNVNNQTNQELSWKERTERKISWKEERQDEDTNEVRSGRKKYFGSFNLFPAKKVLKKKSLSENNDNNISSYHQDSSQDDEVKDADEDVNCDKRSQARSKSTLSCIVNGISSSTSNNSTTAAMSTSVMNPETVIVNTNNLPRKSSLKPSSSSTKIMPHVNKELSTAYENEGFDSDNHRNNNEEDDTISDKERPSFNKTSPTTGRRKSIVTFNENPEVLLFSPNKKK